MSTWQEFEGIQALDGDIQLVKVWVQSGSRPQQRPVDASVTLDTLYNHFIASYQKQCLMSEVD